MDFHKAFQAENLENGHQFLGIVYLHASRHEHL